MCYLSGHGVSGQMQEYVLNDSTPGANVITIEEKLRAIAKTNQTSIIAFYDICRSDKATFEGLKGGKRGIDEEMDFGDNYEYMHIGTHPTATVDAKSGLAKLIIRHLTKKANDDPHNLIVVPSCFVGMGGVEKTDTGSGYKLKWKDA